MVSIIEKQSKNGHTCKTSSIVSILKTISGSKTPHLQALEVLLELYKVSTGSIDCSEVRQELLSNLNQFWHKVVPYP